MVGKIIKSTFESANSIFNDYGIDFSAIYNQNLEESTYTKNNQLKRILTISDLDLPKEELEKHFRVSPLIALFNYSPLRKHPNFKQNSTVTVNLETSINEAITEAMPDWSKAERWNNPNPRIEKPPYSLYSSIHKVRDGVVPEEVYKVLARDAMPIEMDINVKFLTSQTELVNAMQFLLLSKFIPMWNFTMHLKPDNKDTDYTLDYQVRCDEIADVGHVEYKSYGNLQHIDLQFTVSGILLSPFISTIDYIEKVEMDIGVGIS